MPPPYNHRWYPVIECQPISVAGCHTWLSALLNRISLYTLSYMYIVCVMVYINILHCICAIIYRVVQKKVSHSSIMNQCPQWRVRLSARICRTAGVVQNDDMHFVWFSMSDGFFSLRVSESRPNRVATRVGFGDEWWEIHLTWKNIQKYFTL